jgi:Ketopantoate reductase PanE/ApbA C terminal
MSNATSSTAQDIARGKRMEIDSLNGYIVQRGSELEIPTPVNFTVHALVKLLEARNESEVKRVIAPPVPRFGDGARPACQEAGICFWF